MTAAAQTDDLDVGETIAWVARESAKMADVPKLPPTREPKKQRNIKVEDPLWDKAAAKAARQGKSTSEYLRMLIELDTRDDD